MVVFRPLTRMAEECTNVMRAILDGGVDGELDFVELGADNGVFLDVTPAVDVADEDLKFARAFSGVEMIMKDLIELEVVAGGFVGLLDLAVNFDFDVSGDHFLVHEEG